MRMVIDIPRKTYEHIRSWGGHGIFNIQGDDNLIVTKAIFNSTPYEDRPQGEWKKDSYAGIHCSECDYFPLKDVVITIHADGTRVKSGNWNLTPYCPNCGAKMTGGRE